MQSSAEQSARRRRHRRQRDAVKSVRVESARMVGVNEAVTVTHPLLPADNGTNERTTERTRARANE